MLRRCARAHCSQYSWGRPFSIDVTQVSGTMSASSVGVLPHKSHATTIRA